MELKDWIKAARQHAGMTQAQLAEAIGRTKANISSWEAGRHRPSIQQARDLARLTSYPFLDMEARQIGAAWPFETVDMERWTKLSERQKGVLEEAINSKLAELEARESGLGNSMAA